MAEPRIAVVGATGAVGSVTLRLLKERGYGQVRAFASSRSVGKKLDGGLIVEEATPEALAAGDIDLALFSVGTSASRELVPHAAQQRVHHRFVAKKVVPLVINQVGRDDGGVAMIALFHQLEEGVGLFGFEI